MENFDDKKKKKDRQIENLENLVERHTRTKRHLEQYSEIGNHENKENARKIQEIREEQIKELEGKLKDEDKYISPEEQLENLKENYANTQSYIEDNKDSIDDQVLNNLQKKQEHRKEQISFLKDEN